MAQDQKWPGPFLFSAGGQSMGAFSFKGLDIVNPINRITSGMVALAQNVRAYIKGGITSRNLLTAALYTLGAAVHSIKRLNDSTSSSLLPSGYTIINGAGTVLSAWNTALGVDNIATGLSGNPVSIVPFRPNASVQPWAYVGDSAPQGQVTIKTQYLVTTGPHANQPVNFVTNGFNKVRSDGRIYKGGIAEPSLAPTVSTSNSSASFGGGTGNLLVTAIPWTNNPIGTNADFDYGETEGYPHTDPTSPQDGTIWFTVDVLNATYVTIDSLVPNGTVVINGTTITTQAELAALSSSRVGAGTPGYPGQFLQTLGSPTGPTTASFVVGAFINSSGDVMDKGVAPRYVPSVVDVGGSIGSNITVPYGASSFQIGMNSKGNTFSSNSGSIGSGSITISGTVTTNALPSVLSILGDLTAYYWGDSPTTYDVSSYIWKNPDDTGGSGKTRSTSDAVGRTTGNSFIFDTSFGTSAVPELPSGIPGLPGIGNSTIAMEWFQLTPESVVSGSNPVYSPAIKGVDGNTQFANFNFCLIGELYFPDAGNYTFVLTYKDDIIWGIGGGVTLVSSSSGSSVSSFGQTITAAKGYTLLPRPRESSGESGGVGTCTIVVKAPAAGIYPIEVYFDYWYHSGRILLIMASPNRVGAAIAILRLSPLCPPM